jgi:hypothetical protein
MAPYEQGKDPVTRCIDWGWFLVIIPRFISM